MRCSLALIAIAACGTDSPSSPGPAGPAAPADQAAPAEPEPDEAFVLDARFEAQLLAAAAEYAGWGYVDERPNQAPMLCRMPRAVDYGMPARARHSSDGPHGEKLYYLAAKNRDAYLNVMSRPAEVGQVIVKEAWTAIDGPAPPPRNRNAPRASLETRLDRIQQARVGDGFVHTGEKAGLYIMLKLAADTDGTDDGWVYGTLTADGSKVTSAGRVRPCMSCHESAPHGRLFGLKAGGAPSDQEIIEERKARGVGHPGE
jgi:hypothetical protein